MRYIVCVFWFASFFVVRSACAQEAFSPYYVVIGGFQNEENAKRYCMYAQEQNLPAVYAFNEERKIFYVYVRATQTKDVADDILARLRTATVFRDAWVFNGQLAGSSVTARKPPVIEKISPAQGTEEKVEPVADTTENTSSASVPEETPLPSSTPTPVGRPFVFKLVNQETGTPVEGMVRLQESERALQFRGYTANDKVYIPAPSNRSGKWIVVGEALGFRPLKKSVVYAKADQLEGASKGSDNEIIIPLELKRVKKGDYIEMENVKFFNNTALMAPGSETELDQLVAMMADNPGYQIRLHGHTNGEQERDIVSIGKSTNFFGSDVANAKTHGSAKELSLMRAELVKAYLVQQGVDASRIGTKAEGGRAMIYDPSGTLAGLNDRVEVEIRKK
jgi:outer membrane protein OmpA-like peptidoglycan-associated protein